MANFYSRITDGQAELIRTTPLFFVGTAAPDLRDGPDGNGPVNLSPRGGVALHIVTPNRVAFLDYTGSGNETARHLAAGGAMTIMVCSFDPENAAIVRLYGRGRVTSLSESELAETLLRNPARDLKSRPRQVIEMDVTTTMTSCGYGVPVMSFVRDRRISDRGRKFKEPRVVASER